MSPVPASRMGSHGPRVSVCIPVRNGADYIAECLESVLAQTFGDFELLVVDNCSTDDTETIVRRYTDRRLRYIRNAKNLGLVGNANRCLQLASSEYVGLFHHDDVMLPENLARKVSVLDAHPGVGFVHSNVLLIDQKGRRLAGDIWAEISPEGPENRSSRPFSVREAPSRLQPRVEASHPTKRRARHSPSGA